MYSDQATIEIFRNGRWQAAAILRPAIPEQGYRGDCRFEYLLDYAAAYAGPTTTRTAGLSCRYPVDFDLRRETHWPPFILDMLPTGYGRQQWLEQLDIKDGPSADWPLLMRGTAFPPGNLRICEAVAAKDRSQPAPTATGELELMDRHPGFVRDDIVQRNEHFIEYAFQHGIYAAGASDVQGVAPKLLLAQDLQGRWHAEGVLPDEQVSTCWIVKRPRGRTAADRLILKNEAAYMQVARSLGLNVYADIEWENDSLFIPRFDRIVTAGQSVGRLGMESLYSLAGIAEYGTAVSHNQLCRSLIRYCNEPERELLEYVKRDIVNVVLGNKDNHARNTAVLRREDGTISLSPLFDFAPMYLDPEGIARVCRWEDDAETAGTPEWARVLECFQDHLPEGKTLLRAFGNKIERLPDILRQAHVDDEIIEHQLRAISAHARQLATL